MENENLLDTVFLPAVDRENFYDSKAYKTLKDNGGDTSLLEGYTEKSSTPVSFDAYIEQGGTKEDWIAKHVTKENADMFFSAIGDFVLDLGKDGVRSIAVGATNGVDFAVNLAPVLTKLYDLAPVPLGGGGVLEASGVQEDIVSKATIASEKLDDAREFLKNYKDDGNVVSKLVQVMGQDLMYSIPIYNKLKSVGMPTVPAFVISGGVGGAIGIEKKLKFTGDDKEQYNSTFTQDFFGKDIAELKKLVGILPNTPYDNIADEVTQALEYSAFSYAIPKLIQGFQFMKKNIPYFAGGAAAVTMTGDDAEASPIKAITNAVKNVPIFKSAVRDAAEKKVTKGNAEQIYNTIKNTPGVKENELKWLGLEDHLKTFGKANKKQFTQEEVLQFIDNNRIDVSEVMFGGPTSKISTELAEDVEFAKNEFERKFLAREYERNPDLRGEVPDELLEDINYDVYNMAFDDDPPGTMDFNTLQTLLGDNPDPSKLFKKTSSGEYEMSIAAGTKGGNKFYIDPMEFEKFVVEQKVRKAKNISNAPRFRDYTEPGGEDYTELVFKIKKGGMDIGIPVEIRNADITTIKNNPFRSPNHMNVKNEIAHVRFKSRDLNGKKVLTVEEMQSDFNIRAAKENRVFAGERPKIADFPFKNTWYEMTIRRLIRYAADNGFDAVAIPKAEVPAKRYREFIDRSQRVEIQMTSNAAKGARKGIYDYTVLYYDDAGKIVDEKNFTQKNYSDIENIIGPKKYKEFEPVFKEVAEGKRISYDDFSSITLESKLPKEIILGSGKGKAKLYDEAIPGYMKKYGKKWNAKVYENEIDLGLALGSTETGSLPVTILEITPEMKQSVQGTPQPLFSYFGGTVLGYEMVKDSIQNNIISDQTN